MKFAPLALLASLALSPTADAGWLGDQWRHHTSNIADAVTLGEAGRRRDRERQEAEERAAAARAAAAAEQKQQRVTALTERQGTLNTVIKDLGYITTNLERLSADFSAVVTGTLAEFNQRSFLKNSVIPTIRNLFTGEAAYAAQLLKLLEDSNAELADLIAKNGQPSADEALKNLSQSQNALTRLREVSAANGQELGVMLQRSAQYLDETSASKLVALLAQNEANLKKVQEFVKIRKGHYEGELAGVVAELNALK